MEKHPKETDCNRTSANQKNDLEPFSPIQVVTTMADHSPEKSEKSFSAKVLCRNYKEMLCFFLHELSNLTCALKHFCKFVVSGILILVFFFIVFKGKVSSSLYYLDLFHGFFFFFLIRDDKGNLVSQELAGEHSFCVSPLLTRGHLYILKIFRFRSPFRFIPLTRFW